MTGGRCPSCGMNNYDWVERCGRCGARLGASTNAANQAQATQPVSAKQGSSTDRRCPSCGGHNYDGREQCGRCGRTLPPLLKERPGEPTTAKTGDPKRSPFASP